MTIPAVHCEARKTSYRQTKEGLVVSFVIHPNDMPDALAVAPLGQRYMLALAAIGDDEQPIGDGLRAEAGDRLGTDSTPPTGREREGLSPAPLPSAASQRGREAYANASEAGKAITRAAILCGDRDFRIWLSGEDISVVAAAQMIREACGVDSRKEFDGNPEALKKFQAIDTEYKMSIGQMAEVRR